MSLPATTEWLWYMVVLYAGVWSPVRCVTVHTPPNTPSTIEAQAKFFQDFFSVQLSPYKIEFGHVCEDPNTWEQRYEKKDYKNHRDMGKVRWGDKKGGYGEHYWDLNHAGHSNNQGNDGDDHDDGSYHESNDPYGESRDDAPSYGNDEYDPEKSSFEETNRNKRAHPKVKVDRKAIESYDTERPKPKRRDPLQTSSTNTETIQKDPPVLRHKQNRQRHAPTEDEPEPREKQQVVLVVNHKDDSTDDQVRSPYQRRPEPTQSVPYESGAGVRQHADPAPAASVPRLFLEPSTGHVVDRATGQAYVLQPINKYN